MKKVIGGAFFFALGMVLLLALFSNIEWKEVVHMLKTFPVLGMLGLFLLTIVFFHLGVVRWQRILRSQGSKVALRSLWRAYLVGFALSFFAPMVALGGELFRGYAVQGTQSISLARGVASVFIEKVLEFTTFLLVVVAGVLILFFWGTSFSLQMAGIISAVAATCLAVLVFFYIRMFRKKSIVRMFLRRGKANHLTEIEEEVSRFFSLNNPAFWYVALLSCIRSVIGFARVWLVIVLLVKKLVFLPAITVLGFYFIASLTPIPASLGTHDAVQVFAFESFGLRAPAGAAFAFVIRIIEGLFALVGILFFLHIVADLIRKTITRRFEKIVNRVQKFSPPSMHNE